MLLAEWNYGIILSGILLPPHCPSCDEVRRREHLAAGERPPLKRNCICVCIASFEVKCSTLKVRLKFLNEISFE